MSKKFSVVGIGNAVVDLISEVDDDFLIRNELDKSSMTLVSKEEQDALLAQCEIKSKIAGGSAANTLRTIGMLGLHCGFIGTVSNDERGHFFLQSMIDSNVEFLLKPINHEVPTGTCAIFVTPDSERTMRTHMGSSDYITDDKLQDIDVENIELLFIEGYQFDTESHKQSIMELTREIKNHGLVALTLSDVFCLKNHYDDFIKLIEYVDILFCNEEEFSYLFKTSLDSDYREVTKHVREFTNAKVVATRSEKGSVVIDEDNTSHYPAVETVDLLDATGAGDQYAAGYLYGFITQNSDEKCAEMGSLLASSVITKYGPFLDENEIKITSKKWLT